MELLEDAFPEYYRFSLPVFPSKDDDVITSPYNALLSLNALAEHADCVLPIENQASAYFIFC
jgi:tubulin epsilon